MAGAGDVYVSSHFLTLLYLNGLFVPRQYQAMMDRMKKRPKRRTMTLSISSWATGDSFFACSILLIVLFSSID